MEQAEPNGTQATAVKTTHGGADGGRSHGGGRADDSRGLTDGGGAGGGGVRGGEPMSQADKVDPEGRGGTDGSGYQCGGGDPEGRGGAGATEDRGAAKMKEGPDGARGTRRSRMSGVPR